nr:MAG TPA: hypothetical protein [Caudoviricetes sp.]
MFLNTYYRLSFKSDVFKNLDKNKFLKMIIFLLILRHLLIW